MKKATCVLAFLLCVLCTIQAKERVIERPPFLARNTPALEVEKMVISDTATVVYVKAFYPPKNWIKIAKGSFLKDPDGHLHPIRRGIGLTLDKEFWMPESGEAEFQLVFPPIPEGVSSVDFSEGDFDGSFKIWGIQLNEKAFRKHTLSQAPIVPKINKEFTLPAPEFTYGKATVKGKITDFRSDMPTSGELRLKDPVRWIDKAEDMKIGEDGTFEVQTNIAAVTPAVLVFPFAQIPCLIAPGKETGVVINPAECARQQSKLHKDSKPYGKKAYFSGYLAGLQQELSDHANVCNLVEDFDRIPSDVNGKDIQGVKNVFLEKRRNALRQIEQAPTSRAAKEVWTANANITTAIGLFMGKDLAMRAHVIGQKMDRAQAMEYYKNTKMELPADYYDTLRELSLNAPTNLYASEYAYGVGIFASQKELVQQTLGTNEGLLFEVMEAFKCYQSIENFTPLSAEQEAALAALPNPAYKEQLSALNEDLLKKIELNKKKSGFTIHEAGNVSNEDLFPSILSKYRGHVLLVDFWATWCGPCRMGNKAMTPMKEELKGEDIVYLYIAGENSPKGTWENMISDIHGEHYRVTDEQWNYLMSNFNIEGVPTYFIVDREGNIAHKVTGFPGAGLIKAELLKALKK